MRKIAIELFSMFTFACFTGWAFQKTAPLFGGEEYAFAKGFGIAILAWVLNMLQRR